MYYKLLIGKSWYSTFEGEDEAAAAAKVAEEAAAKKAADEAAKKAADEKEKSKGARLFSQTEVNEIMANNKRGLQEKNQELIAELEGLKKGTNITTEQRRALEGRIETLQDELLTKEELSKKEQAKIQRVHEKELDKVSKERTMWQERFTDATIIRSITDASVTNSAINPKQIVAILRSKASLQDDVDPEGNPTGELTPKVKFETTDKDGKPVTLDVTIPEAVKQMKDMEEYFNLFKGEGTGGLGAGSRPSGKTVDMKSLAKDSKKYREARKAGKI